MAGLYERLLIARVKKEPTYPCDSGHYLAVTTGRLEPYLRALSVSTLYACEVAPHKLLSSTDEGLTFVHLYNSPARLLCDLNGVLRVEKTQRTSGSYTSDTVPGSQRITHRMISDQIKPVDAKGICQLLNDYDGIRIDAHLATELTVESHHRDTIEQLAKGYAIEEALTAIAFEELSASPAPITAEDRSFATAIGPTCIPHKISITLNGVGGRSFDTYYLVSISEDGATTFPPVRDPALCQTIDNFAGKKRIVVNPAWHDWRSDLLWDFRADALPCIDG